MSALRGAVAFTTRLITGARPVVSGHRRESVLGLPRQAVFFANHSSHLDFLTIWAVLPAHLRSRLRPVAAADYWGSGVRGRFATTLFNPYLVDRGKSAARAPGEEKHGSQLDGMLAVLDAGDSLAIFPEGTRGDGHEIAPFHAGLVRLARQRPDVPIVPVALANLGRILPKGGRIPVPILGTVTFLQPLALQDGESDDHFLTRARDALITAFPDPEAEVHAELAVGAERPSESETR